MKRVLHKFTLWAPPASGGGYAIILGIVATAAPVNSDAKAFLDNQITMWRAIVGAPYFTAWIIVLILIWLAMYLWSSEAATGQSSEVAGAPPLVVLLREFVDRHFHHKSPQAQTQPVASMGMEIVRAASGNRYDWPIWEAVEHVRNAIGDTDEHGCYPETLRQIRQAALEGRVGIWGRRELPPPSQRGFCSAVWTAIDASYWDDHALNPMATGSLWHEHDHTNGEPLIYSERNRYWALRVKRSEIEREWPAPLALNENPSPTAITLASLGAYMRGYPTVRRISQRIAKRLGRSLETEAPTAWDVDVDEAHAHGITTISAMDKTLLDNEELILRASAYFIPKGDLNYRYCFKNLFWVLGGKMGADAYRKLVAPIHLKDMDRGFADLLEKMYKEITAY